MPRVIAISGRRMRADQLILQLVAHGREDLHGTLMREWLGQHLQRGGPASRAIPQNALRRLRNRQMLIQIEPGQYRFEDAAFRDWVLATALLDDGMTSVDDE